MNLSSFKFFWWAAWFFFHFSKSDVSAVEGHPRSLILVPIESAYATCYLSAIVTLVYLAPFRRYCTFLCSWPHPYSTQIWGCFRCTRSPMLGSVRAEASSYSAVKLFSKYSHLCEKHTSTSRTDRQTDRRLTRAWPHGGKKRFFNL